MRPEDKELAALLGQFVPVRIVDFKNVDMNLFRFLEAPVPGPDSGPHTILRRFQPNQHKEEDDPEIANNSPWRYSLHKHGLSVWMDIDRNGYVADSANIGFSPWL